MKIVVQLAIIFAITLAGGTISAYLPIPIPGSVIGLILLFVLLMLRILKKEQIADTATFLVRNFSLFFIPSGVMLLRVYPDIIDELFLFLVVVIVSAILTFLSSTYTVKLVNYLQNRKKGGSNRVVH